MNGGYGAIARVYDKLNSELDYSAWADGIEAAFGKFCDRKPELVLDLACGTGRMTVELARRGYDMIGVDLSAEMLTRARDAAPEILWLLQDMRSFELYGTVGAVVSCLDAVNCLMTPADLEACFKTVCNYLDYGGVFLFDVNTPYKFENIYSDNAYILEDDGIFCGWQNEYDPKTGKCRFYLSVFEENEDGSYERYEDLQCERKYSLEKLRSTLERAGLEFVGVFGGYDMSPITDTTERWYICARKPHPKGDV